jgi:hypothetical protein
VVGTEFKPQYPSPPKRKYSLHKRVVECLK